MEDKQYVNVELVQHLLAAQQRLRWLGHVLRMLNHRYLCYQNTLLFGQVKGHCMPSHLSQVSTI